MSYALSRPAKSPTGAYYEVAASPRGDLLVWFSETGPASWGSGDIGILGIFSFIINKVVFKGRWRIVVGFAPESRSASPSSGILWRQDGVEKKDVESAMGAIVSRIERGDLAPETALPGLT